MNRKYLDELINVLMIESNRGEKELEIFLRGILTPSELEQLAKRLQIVKKLKLGENQRQIATDLEVGIATVTRGSREIEKGRFKYV